MSNLVFVYTVLVLAVSASNIILKRTYLGKRRGVGGEEGALCSPRVWKQAGSTKEKGNTIRRAEGRRVDVGGGGDSDFPVWLSPGNLGKGVCGGE